jgi:hypothetical protein
MTARYLSAAEVGALLDVGRSAVNKWRERHPAGSAHPFPEADVTVGEVPGWVPDRISEIEAWRAGLPGRGRRPNQPE